METINLYRKADDMNKCLQKVVAEFHQRRHVKSMDFQITAMKIEASGKVLIAGDVNGFLYHIPISDLDPETVTKAHEGAIRAICLSSGDSFLTGGDDGQVCVWRKNDLLHQQSFSSPITYIVPHDNSFWVFTTGNTATKLKLFSTGLSKERVYSLGTENPQNPQFISKKSLVSLIYNTTNSVEILNAKGFFSSESHSAQNVLTYCILKETRAIAVSIKHAGIYVWYYGSVTSKFFHESEGDWYFLCSLDHKILVSIGKHREYLIKFWNERSKTCIIEISLVQMPLLFSIDDDEQNLLISLQENNFMKIKLKKKIVNTNFKYNFDICDFAVYNRNIISIGDTYLQYKSQSIYLEGPVTCCKLLRNKIIIAESTTVKLIEDLEHLENREAIMMNKLPIVYIDFANDNQWIVVVGFDGVDSEVVVFDLLENSTVHLIEFIPERVYEARCIRRTLVYSTNTNMCFTAMPKLDYGLIDTPVEKETITRKTFATEKLTFFSDFRETILFCAGMNGRVDIIEIGDITGTHPTIFRGISKSIDTNPEKFTNISKYPLTAIAINVSETFLVIHRENEGIQFWNIADQLLIWRVNTSFESITKILISNKYIYLKGKTTISIIKDPTFQRTQYIDTDESYSGFNHDEEISIIGPEYNSFCFLGMVSSVRDYPRDSYDPLIYDWTIFPYCINIMHIFAFYQYCHLIRDSFFNNCPFIRMSNQLSSLSIALDLNNKELVECIVSELALLCENDHRIISRIEPDLPRLNLASPPSLSKLYELAYQVVKQPRLKKYGAIKKSSGITVISPTYLIEEERFLNPIDETMTVIQEETNLVYRVSSFRMNFNMGSRFGIEFLESLCECTDDDVFRAKIIQDIIIYKWNRAKYSLYLYNFVFFCYVFVLVAYNTIVSAQGVGLEYLTMFFNTVLFIYECLQMSIGAKGYLSNLWNLLDLLRISLTYIYIVIDYCYFHNIYRNESLYSVTIFFTMLLALLRGLSFFECYYKTRSITKIFFEIILDSRDFLLICVYSIFALSFLVISLDLFKEDKLYHGLTTTYNLNFGGLNTSIFEGYTIVWFYLATLATLLLMLNLLVSIMNQTFQNSKENLITKDLKALAERVIEIESVLIWRKDSGTAQYLQSCSPELNEAIVVNKQQARIEALSDEVKSLQIRMNELGKACRSKNHEFIGFIGKMRQQEINYYNQLNRDEGILRNAIEACRK